MSRISIPWMVVTLAACLILSPLLLGYEPVGGDADLLFRPIKAELARSVRLGRLPFWCDRLGLGVPLVADSLVGAFYPPNPLFYGLLDVSAAYGLSMGLHVLATVGTSYAYARCLGIGPWGGAMAALSFAFCGFQAAHVAHEPFTQVLPFLPLALMLAEQFMARGGWSRPAALALVLGAQLLVGHFQFQAWTCGLVILTGLWRMAGDRRPRGRVLGLAAAVAWAGAIAAVQLGPTWELTRVAGFDRPYHLLAVYAFPPAHWAQLALPRLFMSPLDGREDPYWAGLVTSSAEACLYVGTVPLILACLGLAAPRDRALAPWRWIVPASFALATMPRWWGEGFWVLQHLPILGHFRAPARFTLLTSLGLCLLAGRGFDRAWSPRRFRAGMILAILFGSAAAAWGVSWSQHPLVRSGLGDAERTSLLAWAGCTWALSLGVVVAWRLGRVGAWAPVLLAALELGYLYYHGNNPWDWPIPVPEGSPALRRLAEEPAAGLIAGRLEDLPLRAGLTPAFPYLGVTPPPPNYLLEASKSPGPPSQETERWLRRFGVTHGVWEGPVPSRRAEILYLGEDRVLDRLAPKTPGGPARRLWRVERYPDAFPPARAVSRVREAPDWYHLYPHLSRSDAEEEVWFLPEDRPPDDPGPATPAGLARVLRWDGLSGEVEHDGPCYLVIRRAYYPGWTSRVDDGPERPVLRADAGLQAVRLPGAGVSRISVRYRPLGFGLAAAVSLAATSAALLVLTFTLARRAGPGPADPRAQAPAATASTPAVGPQAARHPA